MVDGFLCFMVRRDAPYESLRLPCMPTQAWDMAPS